MPHRRIDVIAPQQPDDAPTEPDAFGLAARAGNCLGRFDELITAPLRVLRAILGLLGLILRLPGLRHGRM
ncbi:MAG: hypothetical protein BGN89_15600 [Alphaproteobacteria bacterium 64-6]|nr:MAG: hypothetical protein BGN89_15600 [Alphaproteobacteria bacterium 64-6]